MLSCASAGVLHSRHHAGSTARPDCAQVLVRVHRSVMNADFVVKMGAGAASAGSNIADHIATVHSRALGGCVSRHVPEQGRDSVAMIDDHGSSIPIDIA